jgi:hypothetical protein
VADEDGNLALFKVGRVLEAEKHPNADRLQITEVTSARASRVDRVRRLELRRRRHRRRRPSRRARCRTGSSSTP